MPLLAIPNISVGRSGPLLERATDALVRSGARVLDTHSDEVHNRSVLTATGGAEALIDAMTALARVCTEVDLTTHRGVHPRVGGLDVCPFVPHETDMDEAIAAAHTTGARIGDEGIPVFFYGTAAKRAATRDLPDIRRGSLDGLIARVSDGLTPDAGPPDIDPRIGAVCVGARGPLIAVNVWLQGSADVAREVAARVREPGRVRSLGLEMGMGRSQVSMNLTSPDEVGIEDAFTRVEAALPSGMEIVATELVGLVADRFLPSPDAKVARLLIEPGHSLESVLDD